MIRAVFWIAFVFVSLSGCSNDSSTNDNFDDVGDLSVQLFRGLELGTAGTEVQNVLGSPNSAGSSNFAGSRFCYGLNCNNSDPSEMEIFFPDANYSRAVLVTVRAPFPERTDSGVGIGATADQVRNAFGTPASDELMVNWIVFERMFSGDVYFGSGSQAVCFSYDSTGRVYQIDYFLVPG